MRYLTTLFLTSIVVAFLYFSLVLLLAPAPIAAEYWVREMITVKRSIAQKYRGQHKIIIASGSSTLFGIDAKQLSDELKIPVLNFGLHAGLSLETILSEAESAAEKDDTIILSLEPHYYCISEPTSWQGRTAIAWEHDRWETMSLQDHIRVISILGPTILWELVEAKIQEAFFPTSIAFRLATLDDKKILAKFASAPEPRTFAYSAYHLDPWGNMRKIEGSFYFGSPKLSPEGRGTICSESRRLLQAFAESLSRKGVALYFANIPYVETGKLNMEKVKAAARQFTDALSQFGPVLDDRSQLILNRTFFFNTPLHLNAEGRKLRTQILVNAIRKNETLLARIQ
jgi:hypothetical protein